ncbi:BA75_02559T0 [Komagataella pastoris]|uniref:Anaphase-promoting complex subunit 2 n=1 Tax=Komagataella pastoris TaxID=4922 RepID=A0A1B2JD15_PICPA|nr:BA75_02559T0 [Komagataella pastoris]
MSLRPLDRSAFLSVFQSESVLPDLQQDWELVKEWITQSLEYQGSIKDPPLRIRTSLRSLNNKHSSGPHLRELFLRVFRKHPIVVDGSLYHRLASVKAVKRKVVEIVRCMSLDESDRSTVERATNAVLQRIIRECPTLEKDLESMISIVLNGQDSYEEERAFKAMKLIHMGDYLGELTVQLIRGKLANYIKITYGGRWNEYVLPELRSWLYEWLLPRIYRIIDPNSFKADSWIQVIYDELITIRINESFEIVENFDTAEPCLEEMKNCLTHTHVREHLVSHFTKLCQERLLHAGINTSTIISFYLLVIKAFLKLDPRGVLLDKVCRPIKHYLRDRDDTVKRIVKALLYENSNELGQLSKELSKPPVAETHFIHDLRDLHWVPDPSEALPDFKKNKISDIIESLISIFDSKHVFVNEFVSIISAQLLDLTSYDFADIAHKIDLLKVRFGENEFNSLNVMIKDVDDSKIIDMKIHKKCPTIPENLHSSIISHLFWPQLEKHKFILPLEVSNSIENYVKEFSTVKPERSIEPIHSQGRVTLSIDVSDQTRSFTVTPDKAVVILKFSTDDSSRISWEVEKLSEELQMDMALLQKNLHFWRQKNVLQQTGSVWSSVTSMEEQEPGITEDANVHDHNEQEELAESMQKYWPFIVGMLTNLGPTALSQMHSFLKMLVPQETPYNATEKQLELYLHSCIEEEKLEVNGDKYKLKK